VTPDGTRVAFMSNREGPFEIFWKRADGSGGVERLTDGGNDTFPRFPQAFTPDGKQLVFSERTGKSLDLRLLSLGGSSKPLVATEFDEHIAEISPDGRWLAYESNASGGFEIYMRPFPNVEEGQWLISRGGGRRPRWAPNGRELFYMAPGARLMSVPLETEAGFAPGRPTELFSGYFAGLPGPTYDVSPDGERFLMLKEDAGGDEAFLLVQNWLEELKRIVPTED
jgi:Tol biopolymer transport system component